MFKWFKDFLEFFKEFEPSDAERAEWRKREMQGKIDYLVGEDLIAWRSGKIERGETPTIKDRDKICIKFLEYWTEFYNRNEEE